VPSASVSPLNRERQIEEKALSVRLSTYKDQPIIGPTCNLPMPIGKKFSKIRTLGLQKGSIVTDNIVFFSGHAPTSDIAQYQFLKPDPRFDDAAHLLLIALISDELPDF